LERVCSIILAAGLGKRMKSDLPKVLHRVLGRPMIDYVLDCAVSSGIERHIVVVGHKAEMVRRHLRGYGVEFVLQAEQLGTGHAVKRAVEYLGPGVETAVVLSGDTPLLTAGTLSSLIENHFERGDDATVLSAIVEDASGYGRIIRDEDGGFLAIREDRDCEESQRKIREINSGIYCFSYPSLVSSLELLRRENDQAEYYLTDTIQIIRDGGGKVSAHPAAHSWEVLGVNDTEQLAEAECLMENRREGGGS